MKSSPSPAKSSRNGEQLFDILLGKHIGPCCDVADQGHVAHGPLLHHGAAVGVVTDLDGTRLAGVAPQVAVSLQRVEVTVHR